MHVREVCKLAVGMCVCMGDVWTHVSMDVCMYEHGCRDRKDLVQYGRICMHGCRPVGT